MARQRRMYQLAGLLALGTAVGAVSALIGRRRRQAMWQEYDVSQESTQETQAQPAPTATAPGPGPVRGMTSVGSLAEQARDSLGAPGNSRFDEDYSGDAIPPIYEPSRERSS